jgi:hypothetical protein
MSTGPNYTSLRRAALQACTQQARDRFAYTQQLFERACTTMSGMLVAMPESA